MSTRTKARQIPEERLFSLKRGVPPPAAQKGHLEVARCLVELGANKDQGTTDDGATPLYIAAQNGHLEVVQFLVESGSNKDHGTTDDGATPFCISAQSDFAVVPDNHKVFGGKTVDKDVFIYFLYKYFDIAFSWKCDLPV